MFTEEPNSTVNLYLNYDDSVLVNSLRWYPFFKLRSILTFDLKDTVVLGNPED